MKFQAIFSMENEKKKKKKKKIKVSSAAAVIGHLKVKIHLLVSM